MPKDYISREAAMDWKVDDALYEDMLVYIPMAQINKHLRSIPAADVEEVVHCNECKFSQLTTEGHCERCDILEECVGSPFLFDVPGDFYCAFGKKRDE